MNRKTIESGRQNATIRDMSTLTLDETMTVAEAAAVLPRADGTRGVAPAWVKELIYRGDIVAKKYGRDWRIDRRSVETYVPDPIGNPNFRKRS